MREKYQQTFGDWFFRVFPPPRLLAMPSVGFDISDTSFRFLELKNTKNGRRINRFGSRKIPEGIVAEGKIENKNAFINELKKIRQEEDLSFIRVSLPEEEAYPFQTTIPKVESSNELRLAVEATLEEYVPIPPQEAVFDFEVIQTTSEGLEVNIVVYGASVIFDYVESLTAAGFTPLSFEVEAQSVARAVIPDNEKGTYMIVDMGNKRTGIGIVSNGILRYTTTIPVGGSAIIEAILSNVDLPEDEIHILKSEQGFAPFRKNEKLYDFLIKTISSLKYEVKKRFEYWNTQTDHASNHVNAIEKIILCGGSANLAGLPDFLSRDLKVPVEMANVWENVFSFEDEIPPIENRFSQGYATAVGLALKNF